MRLKNEAVIALCLYVLSVPAIVVLPIVLWKLSTPLIASTYGKSYELFELFGFCTSIALIVFAYTALRRGESLRKSIPTILFIFVSFHFLVFLTEYSFKMPDYGCYERAAGAIMRAENPYTSCYLYPPFTAQVMGLGYRFVKLVSSQIESGISQENIWSLVYYLYQCSQFFLIQLASLLCYRFAKNLGIKSIPASVFVSALLLLNNPLIRTLRHNQVNLYVLDLVLLAILLLNRYPALSGLAVALGGHIKLLPLVLILPWSAARKITAVVATVISFSVIALIQTNLGRDLTLWNQFLVFSRASPDSFAFLVTPFFRENSLHSLIFNSFQMIARLIGAEPAGVRDIANMVVAVASFVVGIWFVTRFMQREKTFALGKSADNSPSGLSEDTLRLYGHSMDALAFTLIVAPLVWEHHYILAIPIVLWALATRSSTNLLQISIAALLIFDLPTFDVFPFSYHRLVGLVMLLYYTSPGRISFPSSPGIQQGISAHAVSKTV